MTDEFRGFVKPIMTDQPKGGSEALAVSRQPATHLEASGAPCIRYGKTPDVIQEEWFYTPGFSISSAVAGEL